jgi:hypothetical protein
MYAPTTFTDWVRNERTQIEAALELAVRVGHGRYRVFVDADKYNY